MIRPERTYTVRMLRPHRRKKKNWLRCIFSFALLAAIVFACVRFRTQIGQYADTIRVIIKKPDIASVLHAVRRESFGMLCVKDAAGADDCYVFDADGVVFDVVRVVVGDVIARVDDASDFKPALGAPFADGDVWRNMAPVIAYAKDRLPPNRMEFARAARELTVTLTDSGTRLYFNMEIDPAEHIRALTELSKTVPLATLHYADLRVKGRVFYK